MKGGSLRLRLLLGAGAAIFVAMLVAWLVMALLFARHIERRAADELAIDANELLADLRIGPHGKPLVDRLPSDPRFDLPASGLYWQVTTDAGQMRSRSLWDETLSGDGVGEADGWTSRTLPGPFGRRIFLLERRVVLDEGNAGVLVQFARDEDDLRAARREFGLEMALFLALLWLALLAAAWVQVRLGLAPLARVRADLSALRRNPAARMEAGHPSEVEPLTRAINDLAEARERDLTRARRRAADLAHSLKTPLAALAAQSRGARAEGAVAAADGLDRAIAAVGAVVEAELARSRAAAIRQGGEGVVAPVLPAAERVVGVVERTEVGSRIVFDIDVPEDQQIAIAADDLTELLGALVENAARFARRLVRVSTAREGTGILLLVEDDGHGAGYQRRNRPAARWARG
ncbi:hypothetical protein [Niveispirillum sp. KHB5.9]|uniref:hypothetical protein n=1 Tax=Niveispirillum sp. KHB5.9 TaxID=3400269 RepID=UPI003A8B7755